ncbi:V-type ATP synthase subunit F [Candidatus Peregrinibacteria bacterium]|jgi:V/A-type H+/Na+-transporting ATPase subunit F|nr:V-type ATP synthase subunit F [Candidatus Peregrinibacteria bacterium]MBT4631678.1 V-type ATP synthase subunit F [Candidatus Peregrinibacteria bacterium]MBT5517028.1 V-type ATP synthase subunit F [Candidatus Peregrinibacteria bacterium]MBT5823912.1 V-type ATP synthase subunit F [Candidatus Peregrinibacteria bacterium]
MSKYEIAIIGPREVVLGFKAIGLQTEFSMNAEETLQKLTELKSQKVDEREKYAIIFILESHAKNIPKEEYKKITNDALPAIIALPGPEGSTGFGIERLGQIVEKAIGSNILKDK